MNGDIATVVSDVLEMKASLESFPLRVLCLRCQVSSFSNCNKLFSMILHCYPIEGKSSSGYSFDVIIYGASSSTTAAQITFLVVGVPMDTQIDVGWSYETFGVATYNRTCCGFGRTVGSKNFEFVRKEEGRKE